MARGGARTDVELVEDGDDGPDAPAGRSRAHGDARRGSEDRAGPDGDGPNGDGLDGDSPDSDSPNDDGPDADDDAATAHRARRRAVVVGITLVAVLTAVGLVGQAVVTSREQARLAAVADVPGVVDPVDGPVRAAWSTDDLAVLAAGARTPDGSLVVLHEDDDGTASVEAVDPEDGTVGWRTELIGAGNALAVPGGLDPQESEDGCLASPTDPGLLVCRADNAVSYGDGALHTRLPPTVTRLVVLDARDGSVVRELSSTHEPWLLASVVVLGDLVVEAGVEGDVVHLRATTWGGTRAWDTMLPATRTTTQGAQLLLTTTSDHVVVVTPDAARLIDSSGSTLQDVPLSGTSFYRATSGAAVVLSSAVDGGTVVVGADGTRTLPGWWVGLAVDDGSAPGLTLTSDVDGLRAWSADGTALWSSGLRGDTRGDVILLDGRVVLGHGTSVVALDAATGAEDWRVPDLLPETGLATDGRHVLALAAREGRSAPLDVVGIDATGGAVLWRTPLPRPSDMLLSRQGVLSSVTFGGSDDGLQPGITVLR